MSFFDEKPLNLDAISEPLFLEPSSPQQCSFIAEMAIDALLPRGFTWPENFKKAGDILVEALGDGRYDGSSERLFFPITYYYRHSLELMLKEIIKTGAHYVGSAQINAHGHRIIALWQVAKPISLAVVENCSSTLIGWLDAAMTEVDKVDPDGQTLRYPEDIKGVPNPVNVPERVDLKKLSQAVDVIWWFLSGVLDSISPAPTIQKVRIAESDGSLDFIIT